ncbi:MAG: reverse transcriptase domain-containing protein [Candidatus Zhuqueibacterota bacterium]
MAALQKAQAGKKRKNNVTSFIYFQEESLFRLQQELVEKTYRPGPYTTFYIYDKKKRMISAAPFRDRVVHHALCRVIEPIFEAGFIEDSYANRKKKGTHWAVNRCSEFSRENKYVLKFDIKKYFPSIDHAILKTLIRQKISDQDTLWLIDLIIDHSNTQEPVLDYFGGDDLFTPTKRRKGLPLGNQTSQFFANIYLDALDHYVKDGLQCRYYIRYVDDGLVFENDKKQLWNIGKQIGDYLSTLRLRIHPNKYNVMPVRNGVLFLGYRVFPTHKLLPKSNTHGFKRKLRLFQKLYAREILHISDIRPSIHGWLGHALQANTYRIRRRIFSSFVLVKKPKISC